MTVITSPNQLPTATLRAFAVKNETEARALTAGYKEAWLQDNAFYSKQ